MAEETRIEESVDDTAARAHKLYRDSRDHSSVWRQEAREAYDMTAGEQWDEHDRQYMQENQRPLVVFNRILRTVNAIIGTQVANRQETRFIPREMGDVQVNEVLTAAAEWMRDECDAEDEESDAFEDMCVSGMGWTETRLDYETDPDGMVRIDRVDPLEMYWDPGATKKNLSDARWVMRVRTMALSEFMEQWPGVDPQLAAAPWESVEDDVSQREHVYPQDAYKENQLRGKGPKGGPKVRVAQLQWAEPEQRYRIGKGAQQVSAATFEKLRGKLEERSIPHLRQVGMRWKQAFVAGGQVLDEGDCPFPDGPTLRCMTYKRDRNRGLWYGVVKAMIDPQRYGNKFFSQILDILNKNAKGGVMIERDATDDIRAFEQKWARPDAVHILTSGALAQGKVKEKQIVQWPAGLDRMMAFSMDAVHEVTGINLELLGFANREQAGVLEHQRKQAGLTIIAPLFDSMRRYRKEQGRVLLHFIQNYLSDGRLVRIVGQQGEQYVPLAKEDETARYDVIVDEAPTSPNMKERVYGALVEIMPVLAKMGVPMPPELLDYAPIPSALASKWKEMIEQSPGNPEEMGKQLEQAAKEVEKLRNENMGLKDKREQAMLELQAKIEEKQAELQLKREEAEAELALKRQEMEAELELKRQEMLLEADVERQKMQMDGQLAQEKLENESQIKRTEMNSKLGIEREESELRSGPIVGTIGQGLADLAKIVEEMRESNGKAKQIVVERDDKGFLKGATIQ